MCAGGEAYQHDEPWGWSRLPFYRVVAREEDITEDMWAMRPQGPRSYAMLSPALLQVARRAKKHAEIAVRYCRIGGPGDQIAHLPVGLRILSQISGTGRMYHRRRGEHLHNMGIEVRRVRWGRPATPCIPHQTWSRRVPIAAVGRV